MTSKSLANSALVRWYCSGSLSAVSRMSNTTALMSLGKEDIWIDKGHNMDRQVEWGGDMGNRRPWNRERDKGQKVD